MLLKNEWRLIQEFPKYKVNLLGEVRRITTDLISKPMGNDTAPFVRLTRNRKQYHRSVAQLVRTAFPEIRGY